MGKGQILQNLGSGKYELAVVRDLRGLNAKIALIEDRIKTLENETIPDLESQETTAEIAANAARTVMNDTIEDYILGLVTKEEVIAATRDYNQKISAWQKIVSLLNLKKLEVESLEDELSFLQKSLTAAKTNLQAWCIDGQNDLTGDVGTIEVPGELGRLFIQPGYNGNAPYQLSRDGMLCPIMGTTPAGAFLNKGILPGWQKFKPTYRVGTITALDEVSPVQHNQVSVDCEYASLAVRRSCTITLDNARSSAQELNVNQGQVLTNASFRLFGPIITAAQDPYELLYSYGFLECMNLSRGSTVDLSSVHFDIGSRVIVKFEDQSWNKPKVIGFESNPKRVYLKMRLVWSTGQIVNPNNYHVEFIFEKTPGVYWDLIYTFNQRTQLWEVVVNEPVWPEGQYDFITGFELKVNAGRRAWGVYSFGMLPGAVYTIIAFYIP